MIQPPHPAIRYGSNDETLGLAATAQPGRQNSPPLVAADQAMGGFHQQRSQFIVAGLNESRIGLPLAAGSIPGAEPAEACQLLARAKAIKASDFGPQRRRRHQADAFNRQQLLDQRILAGLAFQPLVHLPKFLLKRPQASQTAASLPHRS
jgi:hypothetical protein